MTAADRPRSPRTVRPFATLCFAAGLLVLTACGQTTPGTPGGSGGSTGSTSGEPTGTATAGSGVTDVTVEVMANGTDVDATHRVVCVDGAPAAGTDHPTPEDACAFLSGPDAGLLTALPRKDVACTQQYGGPQKARVHGVVDDSEVNKTFSLTDGCKIGEWDSARALLGMGSGAGT